MRVSECRDCLQAMPSGSILEQAKLGQLLLPYDRGGKGGVVGIALGGLAEQEVPQSGGGVCKTVDG